MNSSANLVKVTDFRRFYFTVILCTVTIKNFEAHQILPKVPAFIPPSMSSRNTPNNTHITLYFIVNFLYAKKSSSMRYIVPLELIYGVIVNEYHLDEESTLAFSILIIHLKDTLLLYLYVRSVTCCMFYSGFGIQLQLP